MKLIRLVPAVAALTLLAACSPMPSTAFVVDGETVTEKQVAAAMEGCGEALGVGVDQFSRSGVVRTLLFGGIFDSLANQMGGVTDEQIDQIVVQQDPSAQAMLDNEACRPLARANGKIALLQQLDQTMLLSALQGADVELNPRYGRWQPSEQSLFIDSGSLSVKAGE